jgi:hypothetical protein
MTVAVALIATPALASNSHSTTAKGQATSPAKLCKSESRKKTNHGKGKSAYSACVVGATRAQKEAREQGSTTTSAAKLCKDQTHKKAASDKKSPFSACVSGVAKARNDAS